MIGAVSLEVFGHWRNTILDPDLYFERTIADRLADSARPEPARLDPGSNAAGSCRRKSALRHRSSPSDPEL